MSDEDKCGLDMILGAFPDIDPMHVLREIIENSKSAEELMDELTMNSAYPKLKQRMDKERREKRRQEFLDRDSFKPGDYLRIFEDPEGHFMNEERQVSALYVQHVRARLLNDFPNMRPDYIDGTMEEHKNLYLPTLRAIQQTQVATGGKTGFRHNIVNVF